MKNRKIVLWIALMIAVIVTANAQQYDPESDFKAELMEGGKSVRITAYRGEKWTLRIPPQIQGVPVTHIGDNAFNGVYKETNITSVIIPDSVTSIGDKAFEGCFRLTNVTIGNSVTRIGNLAFASIKITSVIIHNSVTSIGDFAFSGCTSLTSITISNSVTSIGVFSFDGNLKNVFYALNQTNGTRGTYRTSNPWENAKWQKM